MDNSKELDQIKYEFVSERNASWGKQMKDNPGLHLSISQMTDTYFFEKLAELELRLRKVEAANLMNKPMI